MKVAQVASLGKIQDPQQFQRMASTAIDDILRIINGKLDFSADNLNCAIVSVSAASITPATDFAVTHNLGRQAKYYIPIEKSAACDVYDGVTSKTNSTLYLRATVSVNLTLLIF